MPVTGVSTSQPRSLARSPHGQSPVRVAVTAPPVKSVAPLRSASPAVKCVGKDQPVILRRCSRAADRRCAGRALAGVMMELEDCAFRCWPTWRSAPLTRGRPSRTPSRPLLDAKTAARHGAQICCSRTPRFSPSRAYIIDEVAARDLKYRRRHLANATLITMNTAEEPAEDRLHSMMRLDHNRAISQLAARTQSSVTDIER